MPRPTTRSCPIAEAVCPSSEAGVPARSAQWAASGPQNSHARRATGATKVTASAELRSAGWSMRVERIRHQIATHTATTHAASRSQDDPRRRVTSRREAVHDCEGPAHVRQPMHEAPRSRSDAVPEQARDDQREHEVERDRAEAEPQRSVRRRERNDRVFPSNRSEAVEDDGRNMSDEEHHRQHRDVAMKKRRREARPTVAHPANTRHDPKEDTPGEQQQAHDAGATREIPKSRRAHWSADSASGPMCARVGLDRRAGRRRSRRLGRRGPRNRRDTVPDRVGRRRGRGRDRIAARRRSRAGSRAAGERVRGICAERSHEPDGRDRRPPGDTGDAAKAAVAAMWCGRTHQEPSSPRRLDRHVQRTEVAIRPM